jgi:4-carboxymuconolactone decarboxylase
VSSADVSADAPADRLPPLPDADMTPEQREAVREISAGPRGALIGPFVPLLRSPELMTRLQKVGEHLRFGTVLGLDVLELTILTVAQEWGQQFEWGYHRPLAERAGVPGTVIAALAEGREPTELGGDMALAYSVARQLQRTHAVDEETFTRAVAAFGEDGFVELVATVGYYTTLAMVMNAAQTPPPPPDGGPSLRVGGR